MNIPSSPCIQCDNIYCSKNHTPLPVEIIDVDALSTGNSSAPTTTLADCAISQTQQIIISSQSVDEGVSSPHWPLSTPSSINHDGQSYGSSIIPIANPQRATPSSHCHLFPLYCAAGKPHNNQHCVPIMQRYFNVGNEHYACPSCNSDIDNWIDFMNDHAQPAGQFVGGQKKQLTARMRCEIFPLYCLANIHNLPANCRQLTLPYYRIGDGFACPHCNAYVNTEGDFMSNHASHAGQFAREQKQRILPPSPTCSIFPTSCRAPGHRNPDYCRQLMLGYYHIATG